MWGIAGIDLSNKALGDLETRLLTMRDAMAHRGLDDASRAKALFGFEARTAFEEGVAPDDDWYWPAQ